MYEAYWSLKEKPFQNTPDPKYLYLSAQHEDALMKLTYVVAQNLGAGLLTGVFGCGKTLLAKVILRDLGAQKFCTAYISNPIMTEPAEILRAIVRSFNPQALPEKKTELLVDPLLEKLYNILLDNAREGRENIVIIDEAHAIQDLRFFEQLRLILNFQTEERFLVTLFLLGQPELKDKIDAMKPLAQRVPIRCHLDPLAESGVGEYVNYRLKTASQDQPSAGALKPVFDAATIKAVFEYSGGIPRRINTLCDLVLLSGFAKKIQAIDAQFVRSVIKEFNLG